MNGLGDLALISCSLFLLPISADENNVGLGGDRHLGSFLLISQSVNNYLSLAYSVPGMC